MHKSPLLYQKTRKPSNWLPLGGLAGILFLLFFPYLFRSDILLGPASGLGTDIAYRHWPDLVFYTQTVRETGQIPLWDPSVAGGRPLPGDPVTLWMYPIAWFAFFVLPPATAFSWLGLIHMLWAGVGIFLFLRRGCRSSTLAAGVAGFSFALSPKLLAHLAGGHVGLIYGAVWIPWALWGTHLALEAKWKGAVLAAFSLAMMLPTHMQIPFYTAWFMVAYAGWGTWIRFRRAKPRWDWTSLKITALILPLFVGLGAYVLLPLLELLPYTSRNAFSLTDANWYALPVPLLATVIVPSGFQFPEWMLYPGIVTLILAGIAWGHPKRSLVTFMWGVVGFALVYSVGTATPLFGWIQRLPGFGQLRVPTRMWFFGAAALPILAGLGFDVLNSSSQRWKSRLPFFGFILLSAGIGGIVGLWIISNQFPWRAALTLLIGTLTWIMLLSHVSMPINWKMWGIAGLLIMDLLSTGFWLMQPVSVNELTAPTATYDALREQSGVWRVYSPQGTLPYALAGPDGVQAAEGLLALQIGHMVDLVKAASGCDVEGYGTGIPPCLTAEVGAKNTSMLQPDLLGLLNVRFVYSSEPLIDPSLHLLYNDSDIFLYENAVWLPRTFVTIDPPAEIAPPPNVYVPAIFTQKNANHINIQVDTPKAGTLVISQTWLPGWHATVNGKPASVDRAFGALQGVEVPSGVSQVTLMYQPVGWMWGWRVTIFFLAGLLVAAGIKKVATVT